MSDQDDGNMYRLEGTAGTQQGGLIIMKKGPAGNASQHDFKQPGERKSLLGLDRLAAFKRAENEQTADRPAHSDRHVDRRVNLIS